MPCLPSVRALLAAFALSTIVAPLSSWAASSPPPPVAQPMPSPLDTTDWLIVQGVDSFKNGQLDFCKTSKKGFLPSGCAERGSMTPQQALAKLGPRGAELTGFSPYMSSYGRMLGVVLYYKSASSPLASGDKP